MGRLLPTAALLVLATACGPETSLTGRWEQDCTRPVPDSPAALCDANRDVAYQLHLGHYGSDAAGLLMRFDASAAIGNPFQTREQACFVLLAAKASEEGVEFGLRGYDHGFCEHDAAFDLRLDGEDLVGNLECIRRGAAEEGPGVTSYSIRLVPARGRPRSRCAI